MEIVTFVGLLPLISQEVKLIGDLNNFFHFDHNIFLLDSSAADINQFVSSGDEYPKSVYVFENSNGNIEGLESLTGIGSKNTFVIVVPASSSYDSNSDLLNRILEIQRLDTNMKIGIFFPLSTAMEELQKLFLWCKVHLIVHIFAATYSHPRAVGDRSDRLLNIFSFHPYGLFEVMNVTSCRAYKDFFPSLNYNFRQHTLRVAPFLTRPDELFWIAALRIMNATFTEEKVDYNTLLEYFENGIDIVPYKESARQKFNFFYPMMILSNVVIAPEAEPYSDFSAYLRTFTSDAFFGYSLGAIAAIVLSLSVFRYIDQKKISMFQTLMDVLNLLCNDNGYINYQRLSRAEVFLIVPLTFVGFVVVNGILSNLQSYLTRPVLQPQIRTIEDIYQSPFTISTASEYWKDEAVDAVTSRSKHEDWSDKIVAMERQDFFGQLLMFNTSSSYLIGRTDVVMLLNAQRRLNIRGFYNTEIEISKSYGAYPLNETFLFVEKINEIIHWIHDAGLFEQWLKIFFTGHEQNIVASAHERLKSDREIDIRAIDFPMIVVYGWIASAIVFVIEIIWKKFQFSRIMTPRCRADLTRLKN